MAYLSLVAERLSTPTSKVGVTRYSSSHSIQQQMDIRGTGIRIKGISKLLPWRNVLAIEHAIRTGSVPKSRRRVLAVKAITVVQGGALKLKRERITYVAVWSQMSKGAEHPLGNIMTIGLTSEGVRFGRRRADVDKAPVVTWKSLVKIVSDKIKQVKQGERLQSSKSVRP